MHGLSILVLYIEVYYIVLLLLLLLSISAYNARGYTKGKPVLGRASLVLLSQQIS